MNTAQRVNAIKLAKEAELIMYRLYSYLDDLDLDAQATAIDEALDTTRSVTKYLHDQKPVDAQQPIK